MHPETEIAQDEPGSTNLLTLNPNFRITRSILHKKKIAPKGCVFFVASLKENGRIYSIAHTVNTQGMPDDIEVQIKNILAGKLSEYIQSSPAIKRR